MPILKSCRAADRADLRQQATGAATLNAHWQNFSVV